MNDASAAVELGTWGETRIFAQQTLTPWKLPVDGIVIAVGAEMTPGGLLAGRTDSLQRLALH